MKIFLIALTLSLSILSFQNASALDPNCELVLKAGETRASLPAWQSQTEIVGKFKMEFLKSEGQFYIRRDGKKWEKAPNDPDEIERKFVKQTRDGEFKITDCKNEGGQTIQGIDTTVISYAVGMPKGESFSAKLYIGKDDGLPYALYSNQTKTSYRYRDLEKP